MRKLCASFGAGLCFTEMVSAKGLKYGSENTKELLYTAQDEGVCAAQIFGSEPDIMRLACEHTALEPFPIVDINMGCPVPKIYKNGEGSALLENPLLAENIVKACVKSGKIITVKCRIGVRENEYITKEFAKRMAGAGASLLTIHGRTREQMYGGVADREIIKNVKSALHIPVIANGDILSGADAISMLSDTGADGIAIGRGAVGNPFLFSEITCALEGKEYNEPEISKRIDAALLQLSLAIEEKGEAIAVTEARKQIALYLRSFRGAAKIRALINRALTYKEVADALNSALLEEKYET